MNGETNDVQKNHQNYLIIISRFDLSDNFIVFFTTPKIIYFFLAFLLYYVLFCIA